MELSRSFRKICQAGSGPIGYLVSFMKILSTLFVVLTLAALPSFDDAGPQDPEPERSSQMDLGNFSVSLAVKDLATSLAFYEKLGFEKIGGEAEQNWLVLRNGAARIGLFQGMFENNIMTFNPGWNTDGEALEEFTDVREIQRRLKEQGIELVTEADESTSGPASLVLVDPDGNMILMDQHVE